MTPLPNGPWEKLGADICGPFPTVVEINRSITATSFANCLNKVFATHGLPLQIMTYNGSQFILEEFRNFMKENNITTVSHHTGQLQMMKLSDSTKCSRRPYRHHTLKVKIGNLNFTNCLSIDDSPLHHKRISSMSTDEQEGEV